MSDGLLGGRHHRVVSSHDNDSDIRHLCTTGTHSREGLMTRGIEESNAMAVLQLHVVSTDVLGNTTSLTGNHVGVADVVEQRGLTMIDVTHHRHDRSARNQIVLVVLLFSNGVLNLSRNVFSGESELISNDIDSFCIQTLVDRHHDTDAHTSTNDLIDTHVHHRSQLGNSHELGQFQHLALCCLSCHLLVHALCNCVALLLTILGTLLVLVGLRSQTGQCLLDLACYCLVVNLQRLHRTVLFVLLAALLLLLLVIVVLTVVVILVIVLALLTGLLGCSFDIHLSLTDTLALLAFTSGLLLTFLAALLLGLLLRTSALVQRREVNLAQHIQLRHILSGLQFARSLDGCRSSSLIGNFFFLLLIIILLDCNLFFLWLKGLCLNRLFHFAFSDLKV